MITVLSNLPPLRLAAWRHAVPTLMLVLVSVLWLYRDTFAAMVGIWMASATFTHAFLVPPIVAWLVWRDRKAILAIAPRPQPWAALPMAAVAAAWWLGNLAGVNVLTQTAATGMLVLAVPALLGLAVARRLMFPLAFLLFMVPMGDFLMPTLMIWTADVTVWVLRGFGVPVYREAQQFIIPSGAWSVVEACSGMRFLISSFMVGTLFAYLNYRSLRRRLVFSFVSLVVPVVANWGRAVMIVAIGHLSNNTLAVGVDHLVYGWVFFGIVVMIMYFIGARWSEAPAASAAIPASAAPPAAHGSWPVAALLIALLCLPRLAVWHAEQAPPTMPALVLPVLTGASRATDQTPLQVPQFVGPRAEAVAVYGNGAEAVTVHVAYYRQQTYGHKLVNSENALVKSEDAAWNVVDSRSVSIPTADGLRIDVRGADLREGGLAGSVQGRRARARQIYWVDGRFTTSDAEAALLALASQLAGRGDDAAALTFYQLTDGTDRGESLDRFVAQHLEEFNRWLAGIHMQR